MHNTSEVRSILIVGGGTAGWLTATILASKHDRADGLGLKIKLIEAPDIPIIGVGEGTWPGMRETLRHAGIEEAEFLKECNASFKQASKFVGWRDGTGDDFYYHPFEMPEGFHQGNLVQSWLDGKRETSFSRASCVQEALCEQDLSPKLISSPGYAGVANYGYHLDAGKFSDFLKKHCTQKLGVELVLDKVVKVTSSDSGDISTIGTEKSGDLTADLFIDCTGFRSLLLGAHLGVEFEDKSANMPINSALAVQVPYQKEQPVKSATIATAQEAGWVWDIGLSNRRGVGHVYSSSHISDDKALLQLQTYLGLSDNEFADVTPRKISISPGYRKKFWHKNCVAIGLSAGFLEPLEASAMMIIEASANLIADQMPRNREAMDILSKRFNSRLHYRWQRVIDFLKLHYVLSNRKDEFWKDSASTETISDRLNDDLMLWKYQAPVRGEFEHADEAFPIASYQYVLYGMGYATSNRSVSASSAELNFANAAFEKVTRNTSLLSSKLASNRKLLDLINT